MFSEQLKKYRKLANLSQGELAEQVNSITGQKLKFEHIRSYEGGVNPKIETIEAIAEMLNILEQYLFNDSQNVLNKITKDEIKKNPKQFETFLSNKPFDFIKKIPLLNGYIGAGAFGQNDEIEKLDDIYVDIHTISKQYRNKDIEAIRVAGDSMQPYINEGDIVLYYKFLDGENANGDGKYIISTSQGEQVKNIKFKLNGDTIISSENQSYPSEVIDNESQEYLSIVGKVVGRILRG